MAVPYTMIKYVVGKKDMTDGDWLTSKKLFLVTGWTFFFLINTYYGGALTMFLASDPTLPFNDVRGAFALYPDWKVAVIAGCHIS